MKTSIPTYMKYFFILGSVIMTAYVIVIGNSIISPLLAALITAVLLSALNAKIERFGVPKVLSALFSLLITFIVIILLITFISTQLKDVISEMSLSGTRLSEVINEVHKWITNLLGFSLQEQIKFLNNYLNNFWKTIIGHVPGAFSVTVSYFTMILLYFISLFFFLYYRKFLVSFLYKIFQISEPERLENILNKMTAAIKNYIVGLFIVIATIAILNTIGLLLLGIHHAVFFGILVGIFTIIPYVGIIIGSIIPFLFALITTHSLWYPLGVLLILYCVQFLEGNFITPYVIGKKENINPFIAILGLFIGGMLLGTIGVILAIPILGICKIICDDFNHLQPIGYVLGNPKKEKISVIQKLKKLWNKIKLKK
jgi:predicted PurR-regulated permease PerM